MIETVPENGLNEAFEKLKPFKALYLDGVYEITDTLQCTNKVSVSIFGNHSKIKAAPGFPSNKPMLNCCGTFNSTFYDLRLETAEGSLPAAGLVIGRNVRPLKLRLVDDLTVEGTKPGRPEIGRNSDEISGGKCLFSNMHIKGTYRETPYYNCGGEGHTFLNCLFRSDNTKPAHVDTCYDFANLTGLTPDWLKFNNLNENVSNATKYFYTCFFHNAVKSPIKGGIQLVNLYRGVQNISFRDCSFATGPHPGSTVIDLTQGNGTTYNLLIDGGRVEGHKELKDPRNVRLLRIARKCIDARIVGLRYTIKSDYVISIKGNGQLVNSTLCISKPPETGLIVQAHRAPPA